MEPALGGFGLDIIGSLWAGRSSDCEVSLMRATSKHLETPPTGSEGEFGALQGLYQNAHGRLSLFGGGALAMQVHYNESRGSLEQRWKRRAQALYLWFLICEDQESKTPRSWKTQDRDIVSLRF